MDIIDVSPTRLNTNASDIGHSVTGRMLSIACSPDGKELYAGSYSNIWTSQDGGQKWEQLTWPQPDPSQFDVPGALGGWSVVDIAVALGWRVEKHPRSLARLTHSGFADVVGFGECGMWVALGNGDGTFKNPHVVNSEFGLEAGGWEVDKHPRFLVDLNKDGLADVVGFGFDGVWTAIGKGDGTFHDPVFALNNLGYNQSWRIDKHPRFAMDINGDGFADVIGFGDEFVWTAIGDGLGGFQEARPVHNNFCFNQGWRVEKHPRFVADLDKDGLVDIVAFGDAGVWTAFQNPDGTFRESNPEPVLANFGVQQGWHVDKHPRFVVDLDNDGFPDIIGFGDDGVWTAINDRFGGFGVPQFTPGLFGYNQGWRVNQHPRLVIDLNGDGIADLIGFGDAGIWTAIGKGDGTFLDAQFVHANLGVQQGWRVDRHPRYAANLGHGKVGVVGFGDAGVWSALGDGHGGFPASNFVLSNLGYGTIVLALTANDLAKGSRGLWRSTDWGTNWTQVHQFTTPINLGELQWAQGSDHLVYAAGGSSLAISADAGATFKDVFPWGRGPATSVNHVAVLQNEPADAFPAIIYALGDSTMFVSFDGGVHWIRDKGPLPQNIGGVTSQAANSNSAHVMVISPRCPLQICVAQNGSSGAAAIYRGDYTRFPGTQKSSWAPVTLPAYLTLDPTTNQVQDSGNVFLATTRRGCGDMLFYGAQRLSFAGDFSRSAAWVGPLEPEAPSDWQRLDSGHADLHGFLLSPDFKAQMEGGNYQPDIGTLWMLGDGGIYRSTNGGWNFRPADNATTLSCMSVAGVAIAGAGVALSLNTGDNDGFYSMNGGQNWSYQQYGGGDNDCAFADPLRPHAIMVFTPRWDTAGNLADHTREGQTVSVYQTQPGNLPDASASGHDRKAVTGPPTLADDEPSRDIWNAGSFYAQRGSRPLVLGLAGEIAPSQGDYIFILNPGVAPNSNNAPVLVRTQNIFDIKHRVEWVTTASGPGQGANVFLQGPPLPEANLGVVQAAGGHANTVFFAGGADPKGQGGPSNTNLWTWTAGAAEWTKIVPAPPIQGQSVGAQAAIRFFVSPYQPQVIYILDSDHVKRSDDGGRTWNVDQNLETQLIWGNNPIQIPISTDDDPTGPAGIGIGEHFDLILNDMKFDPNFFAARFAVGRGGAFMTIDGVNWTRLLHTAALPGRPSSCYLDSFSEATATLYVAFAGRSLVKIPDLLLTIIE
ncbi:MAG: VCBS repeat-containing protein [Bradyrhizobium sp.]|uniref:FG-GAP repeat domain-containing protein n=1 Tax=Bradyrhizobium sp. TaxID=376 RepID=UPI001226E92B|nr:VCBS repeat-containing protein [Bradyrhizobium sp.]THD47661.1 MAG: VCBS repeat-containing protein [Bradyrhizobium sp.]